MQSQTLERSIVIQRTKLLQAFEAALKELGIGGSMREQAIAAMKKHLGNSNSRRVRHPPIKLLPLALSVAAGVLIGTYAPGIIRCEAPIDVCRAFRPDSRDLEP
ncbi:MAG: hypothetical protein AAGE92_09650 [Cyanobacteria bacterium P01_G01_bin.4]